MGCAYQTLEHPAGATCAICAQQLNEWGKCGNDLCRDPNRAIDRIEAIAIYSGALKQAIVRLKDSDRHWGWASIFGRLVLGYLNLNSFPPGREYTAIVANPGYKPDGRLGHTELVVQAAATEDIYDHWDFHPTGLRLTGPKTPRGNSLFEKQEAAEELGTLLVIDDALDVADGRILVYDDVCTSGNQLEAIAHRLKAAGAASVVGLVLARTPWTS
jgi:predicted amidophosphoribosyltransferase